MSDFIAQAALPEFLPVLSVSTLTEFGNHPDTLATLLPWLTAEGELVFVQTEEDFE